MRNAQELIDSIKNVPGERFNQDKYWSLTGENCGCVAYHFEMHKFGKLDIHNLRYNEYFDLLRVEFDYIFGKGAIINRVAFEMNWPTYDTFTVQDAIERIKFIDNLKTT